MKKELSKDEKKEVFASLKQSAKIIINIFNPARKLTLVVYLLALVDYIVICKFFTDFAAGVAAFIADIVSLL